LYEPSGKLTISSVDKEILNSQRDIGAIVSQISGGGYKFYSPGLSSPSVLDMDPVKRIGEFESVSHLFEPFDKKLLAHRGSDLLVYSFARSDPHMLGLFAFRLMHRYLDMLK
jgi:hypothetical protein